MTQSVNQPNIPVPDLNLLFQNKKFELKTEMNCIGIGTIVDFSDTDLTVTVQINYLRVIYGGVSQASPNNDSVINQTIPYPQLVKCPLMIASGGTSYLSFPVVKGDQCVIFFNDRDIDTWWSTGSPNSAPNTNRVHDLSDAMIFVGVRPQKNSITGYNHNGPQLTNGSNFISVEDAIRIQANNITLRQALDSLMMALLTWVDTNGDTPNSTTLANLTAATVLIDGVLK